MTALNLFIPFNDAVSISD